MSETLHSKDVEYKVYRHSPPHLFLPGATYLITGATLEKIRFFGDDNLLAMLTSAVLFSFDHHGWNVRAFAILPNHYHVLARSPEVVAPIAETVSSIHKFTALRINRAADQPGRRIWWNYLDSCITFEKSYLARLNYVNFNPVKHGYVESPEKWRFSSYCESHERSPAEMDKAERENPWDRLSFEDDF